jgi:4-aminobutyrate aminotransferase-like enzyme
VVDACLRAACWCWVPARAIRLSPPLVLTKAQAATAVDILDQALSTL